jgi:hypothetical protein
LEAQGSIQEEQKEFLLEILKIAVIYKKFTEEDRLLIIIQAKLERFARYISSKVNLNNYLTQQEVQFGFDFNLYVVDISDQTGTSHYT